MKFFISLFFFLFSLSAHANKSVLMMVPNDFMWSEYALPFKAYKGAGFDVKIAGRFKEKLTPDRRTTTVGHALYAPEAQPIEADLAFAEVNVDNFDAITFVAGNGAWHDFFPDDNVHKVVLQSLQKNKLLGLLCASTGLIGLTGNYDGKSPQFKGRNVVGYYRVEGLISHYGQAKFKAGARNEPTVVVDGNLVTGRNPESSQIFGDKIVEILLSRSPNSKKK